MTSSMAVPDGVRHSYKLDKDGNVMDVTAKSFDELRAEMREEEAAPKWTRRPKRWTTSSLPHAGFFHPDCKRDGSVVKV